VATRRPCCTADPLHRARLTERFLTAIDNDDRTTLLETLTAAFAKQ
jgi:hypothetical protein